jgi:hypothetical protein
MQDYGKRLKSMLHAGKYTSLQSDARETLHYLQLDDDKLTIQVRFKEVEKYSILLDSITMSIPGASPDVETVNERLSAQADAIQKRITFLLESFRLIELDKQNKRAQLRSYPPHSEENNKYYYEIVLDEGVKIHFQRYQYSQDQKRYEKIYSLLTMETFERLINELAKTLTSS